MILLKDYKESKLREKIERLLYFFSKLKTRFSVFPEKLTIQNSEVALPHLKYWAKTKDGLLFRMADHNIHAIFQDHSKIFIETSKKILYFANGGNFETIHLDDLKSDDKKYSEARKRFYLLKEMSKYLV